MVNPQQNKVCGCTDHCPVYAFYRHSVEVWHVTTKWNIRIIVQ